jgi:hypothetical protein
MGNPELYRRVGRLGNRLEDNFERNLKEEAGSLCVELFCYGQTQATGCSEHRKELWGSIKCDYFFNTLGNINFFRKTTLRGVSF